MADRLKAVFGHLNYNSQNEIVHSIRQGPVSALSELPVSSGFKYTVDSGKLTLQQRQFYEENGFLVIKKLVPLTKLQKYRDRFAQICRREVVVHGLTVMRDIAIKDSEFVPGEQAVTKIVDYVACFTGPDVVAMHTMLINKPPDAGKLTSRHPMHQDLHYFPFRPADRIVCSWTAMQTINRENGCLVVVPGTHKGELLVHEYPKWEGGVNKMYHGIQNYSPSQHRVHLDMEEGDTVFFHPLLIHGSGANRSKGFRKSISGHFASGTAYYVDVADTEQQFIADEVLEVVRRKLGPDTKVQFQDVWKYKSRRVKGEDRLTKDAHN